MNSAILSWFKKNQSFINYIILIVLIWLLSFEEPITRLGFAGITILRNLIPLFAILFFIIRAVHNTSEFKKLLSPFVICGAVFAVSGLIGWAANNYQHFLITVQTMYEHLRFWICLWIFVELFRKLPVEKYARRLFFHIAFISTGLIACCILDMLFYIWPRQSYKFGLGSLQLFLAHPSNLAAHLIFLISMLCMLYPYLKKLAGRISFYCIYNLILTFLLLGCVFMTLRTRIFGFIAFFLILYIIMILFKKRLNLPVILIAVAGALAVGWRRFYDFYFSPYAYTMARGQFAINSLDIAKKNFPFGSGFGTFGSRMAQLYYSPLYYQYDMMTTIGVTPDHPAYACDTFFPCILAESGWLGLVAYLGLIFILFIYIMQSQKKIDRSELSYYAVFTAFCLLAYELLETTGTLAFSETYSILIAIPFAFAILKCRE